jgi:hypothetical protein
MAPHLAVDANTDVIATHLPTDGKSGNACARGMAAQVAAGDRLRRAPPRETTLRADDDVRERNRVWPRQVLLAPAAAEGAHELDTRLQVLRL